MDVEAVPSLLKILHVHAWYDYFPCTSPGTFSRCKYTQNCQIMNYDCVVRLHGALYTGHGCMHRTSSK